MKRYCNFKITLLLFINALIIEACDQGAEKPLSLVVSTDQITLESNSTTVSFGIESNTHWSIESSEPWLSIEPATGANAATIQITALANPSKNRTAVITVLGDGVHSQLISITQEGSVFEPYLAKSEPAINEIKAFPLASSSGTFVAERIAISKDMKEIYYCELDKYPPTISSVKYYKYDQNKWAGPFTLFENYWGPAFSKTSDDTLFFQKEGPHFTTFYSVRNNNAWSAPVKFESSNSIHYLVKINQHRYYAASDPIATVGQHDWCSIDIIGSNTIIQSLGLPLNTSGNDLDFFISTDESFIITSRPPSGLFISYKTETKTWTTPVSLGTEINKSSIGSQKWGPYVTSDNKFLFFSSGNSDADNKIYWTRIDQIIENLRP